ncbi:MAG TPA: response regulator [Spirochaetia bacterium]|nr:response regulator [Spirochaetales bacterium]HOT59508.1 response regulator [Spirochaetales bacterium]HQK34545.1 response regulator [Spirochaetales bacterium]HRS64451.1 response regulator [Spirochaetia bacterium]HRV27331.1 response regulator [Spirochaetia bacterium]
MTFVIIEDEYLIALHMQRCLESAGHICLGIEAEGDKGIRLVQEKEPEIIILDILLAGMMSGIDVAKEIRKFSKAMIVFTTGYTSCEMLSKLESISESVVFPKPVSLNKLINYIEKLKQNNN